jgi:ABC-2 type transport system permease protein
VRRPVGNIGIFSRIRAGLRYLLIRPVTRNRILSSKLAVACVTAFLATIAISVSGLIAGTIAFGWHPVATPAGVSFSTSAAVGKLRHG